MARFTRNLALMDIILVGILLVLLYVFVHRLGYSGPSKSSMEPLDKPDLESKFTPQEIQAPNSLDQRPERPDVHLDTVAREKDLVAKDVAKKDVVAKDEEVRKEIDTRLRKIPDHRNMQCLQRSYSHLVSVVNFLYLN